MFPQRAYLSSRSWLNSAGWKLGWKSQPIIFIGGSFRSESRFFAKTRLLGAREEPSLLSNQAVLPIVISSRWVLCSPCRHSPLRLANRANPFQPSETATFVGAGAPARESRHRQCKRGDSLLGCPAGRSTAEERDEQTKLQHPGIHGTISNCHFERSEEPMHSVCSANHNESH